MSNFGEQNKRTLIAATMVFAVSIPHAAEARNGIFGLNNSDVSAKASDANVTTNSSKTQIPIVKKQEEDVVLLIADEIRQGENEDEIIASGNVEAKHQGRRLISDKLIYNRSSNIVTAYGNVIIIEADGTTNFASELVVDDRLTSGIVNDLTTKLGGGAIITAKNAVRQKDSRNILSKVIYTACEVCKENPKPTWAIKARTATQDNVEKTISYRDVLFEIEGVPIAYFPYFKHGDPTAGRQSGFLQSIPSHNSRFGYSWEQPYLHLIDDYSDIVISPRISQYVNPIIGLDYRRRFYSGDLNISGSITHEKIFGAKQKFYGEEDWRSHIFGSGNFDINDTWKWGFGLAIASDEYYLSRYSIRSRTQDSGIIRSTGSRLLSQTYIEGKESDFYSRIMAVKIQDLTSPERRKLTPKVLPSGEIRKSWKIGPYDGKLTAIASLLFLSRTEDQQDSGRISGNIEWDARKIIGNGIIVEPSANLRTDFYNYKNQTDANGNLLGDKNFTNINAAAAIDFKMPFAKFNNSSSIIIEPRIKLRTATTKNNNYVTLEDAATVENNASSIFMINRNSIYDYWDGGSSITMGTSLAYNTKSNKNVSFFIGKQFRSDDNPFLERLSNYDSKKGDWVTQVDLKLNDKFKLTADARFDNSGNLVRTEIASNLSWWRLNLTNRYHNLPKSIVGADRANQELVTGAQFKVNDKVKLFADTWHDFINDKTLRTRAGILLSDNCTDLKIFMEENNTSNRFIGPTRNFKFQIAFKSLGTLDDDPFDGN